jgi:uncharacterized protein YndB with AHSA1/START domain
MIVMAQKLEVDTSNPLEIKMTRVFNAPRKLVYRAMSEPELVKKWLGGTCERARVISVEMDVRVGGTYKNVFGTPDGGSFTFTGTYKEVSEERVVHTEVFNDQPGGALVINTLTEVNGKTTLVAIMRFETQEIRDMVLGTGMAVGAGESYDALDELLQTL